MTNEQAKLLIEAILLNARVVASTQSYPPMDLISRINDLSAENRRVLLG